MNFFVQRSAPSIAQPRAAERTAHRILSELIEEDYVLRKPHGRCNRCRVVGRACPCVHPLVQEREVGELLEIFVDHDCSGDGSDVSV